MAISVATAKPDHRQTAWVEGFVVMVAVAICSLVTAANNYSKERQFQELNKVADARKRVSVRRQGQLMELHQDDLLVGDVVVISEGMEIPADAIVLEGNEITTDESAMTG
jgi:P-type E1-E2 ATPase